MKTYLISMKWPCGTEPIAIGSNKKKLKKFALQKMRQKEGVGSVSRGAAMCSAPIAYDDFSVEEVEIVS